MEWNGQLGLLLRETISAGKITNIFMNFIRF